jgi:hypothetical protein
VSRFLPLSVLAAAWFTGCSTPNGDIPSLEPRAAERIDPRVPVERPPNDRPVSPGLAARLEVLIAQARAGEAGFEAAIAAARRTADGAGARETESWIVAQEALSAAVAAREPAAMAISEIDSIAAELLIAQGGLAPADLAAIENASQIVATISRSQADAVTAVQARLGT